MPELLEGPFRIVSLSVRRIKALPKCMCITREFGAGKHQQVDDYQYGGGAGHDHAM